MAAMTSLAVDGHSKQRPYRTSIAVVSTAHIRIYSPSNQRIPPQMTKVDITPVEGLHPEVSLLRAMLDDVTKKWTNELGRVSRETIIWQPRPEGHSIGAIILHIADVEAFWLHQVGAGETLSEAHNRLFLSKETQQYAGTWPIPPKR